MWLMGGEHSWVCVALLSALCSVSAVQKLKTIEDLKEIDFGESVPTHSLVLLHWFANTIIIDDNNRIRLTFDPSNGDYGSHPYRNREWLLDPLPQGHRYYTVGRLRQETSVELPDYVVDPPACVDGRDRDRIVFRVCGERIDRVYITQHYEDSDGQGALYDPDHTYQITTHLLGQIQEFSLRRSFNNLVQLRDRYEGDVDVSTVRNSWRHLACLGLFLCIVMNETVYYQEQRRRPERRQRPELNPSRGPGSNNSKWTDNKWLRCGLVLVLFAFIVFLCYSANILPRA